MMTQEMVIDKIKDTIRSRFASLYLGKNYKIVYDSKCESAYQNEYAKEIHIGDKMFLKTIIEAKDPKAIDLDKTITTVLFHEIAHGIYSNKRLLERYSKGFDSMVARFFGNSFNLGNLIEDARIEYYATAWGVQGVDFPYTVRTLLGYNKKTFKPSNFNEYMFGLTRFNHETYVEDKNLIDTLYEMFDKNRNINCVGYVETKEWDFREDTFVYKLDAWAKKCYENWKKYNPAIEATEDEIDSVENYLKSYDISSNSEVLDDELLEIAKKVKEIYSHKAKSLEDQIEQFVAVKAIRNVIYDLITAKKTDIIKSIDLEKLNEISAPRSARDLVNKVIYGYHSARQLLIDNGMEDVILVAEDLVSLKMV